MNRVDLSRVEDIAVAALDRGKVNAIDEKAVDELHRVLETLRRNEAVRALILTGTGKFFSFGFDVPGFLDHSKEAFTDFLRAFTSLYLELFVFPKPVIAALNGHAIAGGCMLALACDRCVMATGKARISLNEITFGASVFAGCVEMLRHRVGDRRAETILLTGRMYEAEEAGTMGLVDRVASPADLQLAALEEARQMAREDGAAFRSIKSLLREPVAERMRQREEASIREFADIWYSRETRKRLREIRIRV